MDQELFGVWFSNHFLRYAPAARPLLLLLDGHASHYCPDTVRLAAKEKVILFTLPPNTTHLSQPLDKGCFGPLKVAWREVCHQYLAANPGRIVTRYQFSALLNQAWMKSRTVSNVCSGFRMTGVYPINRDVFPCVVEDPPLHKETGLAFIPLYSPAPRRSTRPRTPSASQEDPFECGRSAANNLPLAYHDNVGVTPANTQHVWMQSPQFSSVSQFLRYPSPPCKSTTLHPKSCGRVLTSSEHLAAMEAKEREKQEREREGKTGTEENERRKENEGNSE